MNPTRRASLIAGTFYVLTFVSIPTLWLYNAVRTAGYLSGPGPDDAALWGGFSEVIVALTGIGTAVALYPVIRRHGPARAVGFVATRTVEAAVIFVGVANILSLVNLRRSGLDASPAALELTRHTLMTNYDMAFLLGQSLMPAINALLLGTLLYQARLVPRILPLIGLIGVPFHLSAVTLTLFGVIDRISPFTGLAAMPIAVWEFSLGVYLIVKGLRTTDVIDDVPATVPAQPVRPLPIH